MKILHVLSSIDYNGAAKQALLLGRSLKRSCELRVCVLSSVGPWMESLSAHGIPVHFLNWNRIIDPTAPWRLHGLLRDYNPDVIHVWRLPALRALALAGHDFLPRSLVSQVLPRDRLPAWVGGWDRFLLYRVAKIIAGGAWEAHCLQTQGFGPARVTVIPPGVELPTQVPTLRLGRHLVCFGNLQPYKGFREALRAADYLAYCFTDLQFELIGSGPYWPSLKRFHESVYHPNRLHLSGKSDDSEACLAHAAMCWVPSLTATGTQVALEAMAAGLPVVASDLPHLREIINDGETGLLVAPGDKNTLARRARRLFHDDARRKALGEAGHHRVRKLFAAADFVDRCRDVYGLGSKNLGEETFCPERKVS